MSKCSREEIIIAIRNIYCEDCEHSSDKSKLESIVTEAGREFGSWFKAMRAAGLQTVVEWRKKQKIMLQQFLDHNPSKFKEIKKQLGVEYFTPSLLKKIEHIGPRGDRLYYLPGQEEFAKAKLHNDGEELYGLLQTPNTIDKIEKIIPLTNKNKTLLDTLIRNRLVFKVKFTLTGVGVRHKYKARTLFGELAFKTFYCRHDASKELADLISEKANFKNKNVGLRRSLTAHLKAILPRDVFKLTYRTIK